MQLLVRGSTNGSITGTEIARAQAEAALDLKQMKPVLVTLEAHDIEIVVDAPHTDTKKRTRSGTKGGTVATARSTTAAATTTAKRTTTAKATAKKAAVTTTKAADTAAGDAEDTTATKAAAKPAAKKTAAKKTAAKKTAAKKTAAGAADTDDVDDDAEPEDADPSELEDVEVTDEDDSDEAVETPEAEESEDGDEAAPAAQGAAPAEEAEESGFVIRDDDEDDAPAQQVVTAGATADPVKDYLKQIGKVALLNAEQEVELAKRIEAGLFAEEKLNSGDKIDMKLKRELWWIAQDGKKAKNHLLEANLRLVVSLAKRYTGRGMLFLDLIQEGNLGLIR